MNVMHHSINGSCRRHLVRGKCAIALRRPKLNCACQPLYMAFHIVLHSLTFHCHCNLNQHIVKIRMEVVRIRAAPVSNNNNNNDNNNFKIKAL